MRSVNGDKDIDADQHGRYRRERQSRHSHDEDPPLFPHRAAYQVAVRVASEHDCDHGALPPINVAGIIGNAAFGVGLKGFVF